MYERMPQWGRSIGLAGAPTRGLGMFMRGLGQDDGTDEPIDTTPVDITNLPTSTITSLPLQPVDTSTVIGPTAITPLSSTDTLAYYQAEQDALTPAQAAAQLAAITPTSYTTPSGTTATAPAGALTAPLSTNTAAWAAFATQLAKSGMTLAEISAIQPGEVVLPNGTVIGSASSSTLSSLLSGTGISSEYLVIGGGILLLVLLMSSMKR